MQQKTVTLAPGVSGVILVRAKKVDASGNITYSDYASYNYSSTGLSPSGGNTLSTNTNGDVLLAGGSIYAGNFPNIATGSFDPSVNTTTGSGVVLNKYGIAGYNSGTQEFYINARTGNAIFAGNVSSNAIISGVLASDLVNNAAAGSALVSTVNTISSNYIKVVGDQIQNATGQISAVSANGTTFYSGNSSSSGARVVINQYGILGYNSSSTGDLNNISFAINSTSSPIAGSNVTIPAGSAYFAGQIISTSGSIGGWSLGNNLISSSGSYVLTTLNAATGTLTLVNSGVNSAYNTLTLGGSSVSSSTFGALITITQPTSGYSSLAIYNQGYNSAIVGVNNTSFGGNSSIAVINSSTENSVKLAGTNIYLYGKYGGDATNGHSQSKSSDSSLTLQSSSYSQYTALRNTFLYSSWSPDNSYGNDGDIVLVYSWQIM